MTTGGTVQPHEALLDIVAIAYRKHYGITSGVPPEVVELIELLVNSLTALTAQSALGVAPQNAPVELS